MDKSPRVSLPEETNVVVIGAGIIGLCNALQFAKRGLKVVLIDNLVGQKKSYKVGESLLIFSNMFLRTVGDLDPFLSKSFPKHGIWLTYGMEGSRTWEDKMEFAMVSSLPKRYQKAFISQDAYRAYSEDVQIVRPEAEEQLVQNIRNHPNIIFLDTGKVKHVEIGEGNQSHQVFWECRATRTKGCLRSRWLLDCSGRNRFLAKKLGHFAEQDLFNDAYQTTAVWGQFSGIKDDMFKDWAYQFSDGQKEQRDHSTLHLWGEGYWIWVIRLAGERISVGVTFLKDNPPQGKRFQDQFWDMIQRYPIFDDILSKDNLLEFRCYKNVQHITDTFVSPKRYGMVGDAAGIIDAYYSQGISLSLVTSWHIANIVEKDVLANHLDTEYIETVNHNTHQDWQILRNMFKPKYSPAMADGRFFFLTHLLDLVMFIGIALPRHHLFRWLRETKGQPEKEKPVHRWIRKKLRKQLYYSQNGIWKWFAPAALKKTQEKWQTRLAERALWRRENGIGVPRFLNVLRIPAWPSWLLKVPFISRQFANITPGVVPWEPKFMRLRGTETWFPTLRIVSFMAPIMFLFFYYWDGMLTGFQKLVHPQKAKKPVKS